MRFTIKAKLAAGFGAVLLLAGVAGGFGYTRLDTTRSDILDGARLSRIATFSEDAAKLVADAGSNLRAMILNTDPAEMTKDKEEIARLLRDADEDFQKIDGLLVQPTMKKELADVRTNIAHVRDIGDQVEKLAMLNSNAAAVGLLNKEGRPALEELRKAIDDVQHGAQINITADAREEFATFPMSVERAWGSLKGSIAATDVTMLETYNKEAQAERKSATEARDIAVKSVSAAGPAADALAFAFDRWLGVFDKIFAVNAEGGNLKAGDLVNGDFATALRSATTALDTLSNDAVEHETAASDDTSKRASEAMTIMALVLGAAIVTGLTIATVLSLSVSRGLAKAVGLADAVALGDLSQRVEVRSSDEIGALVTSLNNMVGNLNNTARIADEIAAGNLTTEAKRISEKDRLGIALETMLGKLRLIVADTMSAAQNVSSGSQQLSASAEQLSQGSTEQGFRDRRSLRLDGGDGRQCEAERRECQPDREDRPPIGQERRGERDRGRQGGRGHADHRVQDHHRAGDRPPDRPSGSECRRRSGAGRRTRPRLRGRGLRSPQARRTLVRPPPAEIGALSSETMKAAQ